MRRYVDGEGKPVSHSNVRLADYLASLRRKIRNRSFTAAMAFQKKRDFYTSQRQHDRGRHAKTGMAAQIDDIIFDRLRVIHETDHERTPGQSYCPRESRKPS